jgi:hypothetical protein
VAHARRANFDQDLASARTVELHGFETQFALGTIGYCRANVHRMPRLVEYWPGYQERTAGTGSAASLAPGGGENPESERPDPQGESTGRAMRKNEVCAHGVHNEGGAADTQQHSGSNRERPGLTDVQRMLVGELVHDFETSIVEKLLGCAEVGKLILLDAVGIDELA